MISATKQFEHLKIKLEAIKLATNNFADANCIGRGGFGEVYKGELVHSKGHTVVALKRLNRAFGQGDPEFWKEIIMLSLYKHDNIVSLLGFCDESGEKILVYEYASRRSLDLYLDSNDLTWTRRLKICIGAARGLAYLHSSIGTHQRVLHRDIKSSNILLDENWNARISDMGLSKFGPANQQITFLISHAVGTLGYCDPQYIETGLLTKESDVYSFGVVLFEVLCGRLCIYNNENDKRPPLTGLARRCYEKQKLGEIIFSNIKDEINPLSLKEFTKVAYQCLKRDPEERPLMSGVLTRLQIALKCQVTASRYGINNTLDPHHVSAETFFKTEGVNYEDYKQNGREELVMLAERRPVSSFIQSDIKGRIEAVLRTRLIGARGNTSFETKGENYEGYKNFLEEMKEYGRVELADLAQYKPVSNFVQNQRDLIKDLLRRRFIKAEPRGVDEEEATTDDKIRPSVMRQKHSISLPN